MLKTMHYKILEYSSSRFIIALYIILVISFILPVEIIQNLFFSYTVEENEFSSISDNWVYSLILVSVVGPIIETLIFQIVLIKFFHYILMVYFNKGKNVISIKFGSVFLSALVFGATHYFSLFYALVIFILGLFIIIQKRKELFLFTH